MLDFIQIRNVVIEFIKENFKNNGKIIELKKEEDKWLTNVEIIEEADYVRRLGKTDIIGLYEIEVSLSGEILGFKRILLRERSQL